MQITFAEAGVITPQNHEAAMKEMMKIQPVKGKTFLKGTTVSACSDCQQELLALPGLVACYFNSELNNGMFPMPLVQAGYSLYSKYISKLFYRSV